MTDTHTHQQSPTYDAEEIAKRFEAMAAQIRLNKDGKFGGAFLLVPPAQTGNVVETLVLSDQNAGLFWATVKMLIDAQYKTLQDQQNFQQSFGRPA